MQPTAFFLDTQSRPDGRRFCLFHAPQGTPRGWIVHLHPFAEEMNKSRRMAALQSRAFAAAGYGVLRIDLLGCGDSEGDFGDASWSAWIDDALAACAWLRQHQPAAPLWLWGLRTGCLLAAATAHRLAAQDEADDAGPVHCLFWQPVASGQTALQQFLRLRFAGDLIAGGGKGALEALRRQLAAGETVEVAGYALAPALADGLAQATLAPPPRAGRLEWLEAAPPATRDDAPPALSPVAAQTLARWHDAGHAVRGHVRRGPAFWQTTEIEEAPAWLDATLAAVAGPAPAALATPAAAASRGVVQPRTAAA